MDQLTKSAFLVQSALDRFNLDCEVKQLAASTRTAQDAAQTIGCEVGQIVKSLIFKTKSTNKPILILASGINRVNEKIVEKYLEEKITKADADFTREVTGFAIGGIPPIGHQQLIDLIFIDQDLLQYHEVWAAAGTPNAVFKIEVKNLVDITKGNIVNIT